MCSCTHESFIPVVRCVRLCGRGSGKATLRADSPISLSDKIEDEEEGDTTTGQNVFIKEDYIGLGLTWKEPMDKKVVGARNAAS
jgi:hypothetical protein